MSKKRIVCGIFFVMALLGGVIRLSEGREENISGTLMLMLFCAAVAAFCFAPLFRKKRSSAKPQGIATSFLRPREADTLCDTLFSQGPQAAMDALRATAEAEGVGAEELRKRIVKAVPFAMEKAMEDNILTEDEERALGEFFTLAGLGREDIGSNLEVLVKAALIRDLLQGTVKPRAVAENLPFTLNKNETLIWAFPSVEAGEYRTKAEYTGGSQGVSIRVAKGVYWRTGAFKGEKVQRQVLNVIGTGSLAVTSHHLYFKAGTDAIRQALRNVISITPLEGAVMVHRSGERNMPLVFGSSDPWFLANILSNAQNWA